MRLRLNYAGFRELRKSLDEDLLARGEKIAEACGDGYKAEAAPSKNRARVTVFPDTVEAMETEARELNLLKNIKKAR